MKKLPKVAKSDYKYMKADPDPGFSPEHNKYMIEKTIRDYDAMMLQKRKEAQEKAAERSQAVASYLKSLERGRSNSDLQGYFGKHELARLRGQEIKGKLLDHLRELTPGAKLMRKVVSHGKTES